MTRVIVDTTVRAQLDKIKEPAELCDEAGRVLGRYLPVLDATLYQRMEVPISEEELDRREREAGGRSLAEILADLEKRA
jgi:hypothetical protein